MSIYLFDAQAMDIVWELDVALSEQMRLEAEWTKHPIEDDGEIASYAALQPAQITVEGAITAWPLSLGHDAQRPGDAWDELQARWRARQPLTLVTMWWAEQVGIVSAEGAMARGDGEQMHVSLTLTRIETVTPEYTTIPASRIKRSVRAHAAPKKTGGAGSTTSPSAGATSRKKSWLASLVDSAGGMIGR